MVHHICLTIEPSKSCIIVHCDWKKFSLDFFSITIPKEYMYWFIIVMIFCFSSIRCGKNQGEKIPLPAQHISPMKPPVFDRQRAFGYLTAQTDFGPRVTGTSAHQQCLQYLKNELQKNADSVSFQPFTHTGYNGETLNMTNIIASFNLRATSRILLIAHWDSR